MKIARYITDDKVSVKDKIIGSDGDKSNKTKNFPITGISNFVLGQLKNSGVVFRFSNGATPDLEIGEPGYFFSESNIIDKTQLTKLYFSTDSFFGEELLELFASVGSNLGELYLGLSQQDDSANYGFFNVADAVNINDDYFEITVDLRGQMFAKQLVDGKNYSLFFDLASSTEYDIDIVGGEFQLLKNGAVYKTKDLSVYLDDTNLSRLTSGSVDENGIATFVRDDASSFTVDFSDFLSGITPTRTSHLINDGDGTSRYVTLLETYLRSEIDNKDATIQAQVTKLNGLKIERDTAQNRVNLIDGTGAILSWITDYNIDGMGYRIEFDADARTIYIIDSQGNIADTIPLSILVNDKLDKGNYPGNAETLKAEIDAIAGQLSSNAETRIIEFYEGHITGYEYNSTCKWVFDGVNFTKTKKLTFPAADPTNDMIGLWYADNAGDIGIVTGAPSVNPVQPSLPDPENQIQIKFIIIPAGSTEPAEISDITLYRENAQVAGGEADTSENTGGVRIALGSVNTPISQTKSIEATGLNTNDKFVLTPGATIPVADLSALKYKIKNKVGVYSNANPLSIRLIGTKGFRTYTEYMPAPWQFGYNKDNSASVQDVSLPIPSLRMTDISAIEFVNNVSSDENFGFFIDEIGFNEGEDNTSGGTTGGVDQQYVDAADANLQSQINSNDTELADHESRITTIENETADPTIDHEYADIATMISNQNEQLEDDIIKVLDASGDPDVTSGKAYYFYDGTVAGTIEDYTLLTSEEIKALTSQNIIDALGFTPEKKRTRKEVDQVSQYTVVASDFTDNQLDFTGIPSGSTINVIVNTGVCPNTEPSTGLQILVHPQSKISFSGTANLTPQPGATLTSANDGTSVAIIGVKPTSSANDFGVFGTLESDGTGGQSYSVYTNSTDGLVPAPNVSGSSTYTATIDSPTEGTEFTEGDTVNVTATLTETVASSTPKILANDGWRDFLKEHEINGVRQTADISGTFAFDWNAYSQFVLNPTADVTLSHANLPADPNTKVISGVFRASASVVTFPANTILVGDSLSDTLDTKFTVEPISATENIFTLENLPA